jgi:diguanylate cyclase (GGDEF)-like protein/PAS domain S-box-containing protein
MSGSRRTRETEETVATDLERLDALSQLPGDVVSLVDKHGVIRAATASVQRTFGFPIAEYIGTEAAEYLHPDDLHIGMAAYNQVVADPDTEARYELRVRHHDGSYRWAEIITRNFLDDPATEALVSNYRDIDERKLAEESLRASEDKFKALVQNSFDVFLILDDHLAIDYVSPSFSKLAGLTEEEILGQTAMEFVHPDDRDDSASDLVKVLEGPGASASTRFRTQRADGEWRWVEASCVNLLDNAHIHGIVCNIRDVTERQAAEDALRRSEERFRALVQNGMDAVAVVSREGEVTYASPAVEELFGRPASEIMGSLGRGFVHNDDLEIVGQSRESDLEKPGVYKLTLRVKHGDGTWHQVEVSLVDLSDNDAINGIVAHIRDITNQRQMEEALRESERLFRSLAQSSPTGIFQQNADGEIIYVNERWEEITGVAEADALGYGARRLVHPDDRKLVGLTDDDLDGGISVPPRFAEYRIMRPNGDVRWVAVSTHPMTDEEGNVTGTVGAISDITDRMEAQRDTQRLIDIFEATHDIVGIADRDGRLLYFNAAARTFFGLQPHGGLDGSNFLDKFSPDVAQRILHDILPAMEREGMWYGELAVIAASGDVIPVLAQLLIHTDEQGRFEFFSAVMHDISERKEFESQLAHQATHDPLTSLPNRVLLLDRLEQALDRARRHGKRVAVLFLDLDHFKVVNDSLGHGVGDRLLVAIADRLRSVVRPGDTIARFGGDEFVVLCEDLETREDAVAVAERVNSVVSGPFEVDDSEVFVGVSIGIAFPDDVDAEPGTLIRDADAAMYRAKERGRARWEIFDNAMRASAVDRLDIENALRRAQERRELRVYYQPIISLATGAIEGIEALIRWEHPERGLLLPNDFIHVAEETGLIVPMGAWVLDQACRQVMRWQASIPALGPLRLSVNLSGRQLGHPSLVADVRAIINDTHINPSQVELEITESVLMDDVEMSEDTLGQLKRLGVKLVVDDFGTGYSSLSYLRRFPVDVLKVDRSYVDGLGSDPSDSAIVTAIVTLAHTLGLSAVAEGVETTEQLEELRRLRCDMAQGYLMARPATGHDTGELLARRPTW